MSLAALRLSEQLCLGCALCHYCEVPKGVPLLLLAIPIMDTLFAIIRRKLKGQSIDHADKEHLHHCLLRYGFSHRDTVLII